MKRVLVIILAIALFISIFPLGALASEAQEAMEQEEQAQLGVQEAPVQDEQQAPAQDGQQAPVQDEQQAPAQDGQQAPAQDGQQAPVQDEQQAPVQDEQQAPVQGNNALTVPTTEESNQDAIMSALNEIAPEKDVNECPFVGQTMPATFYVAKLNISDVNSIDPRPNGNYVRVSGIKGATITVPANVEANAAGTGWGLLCDAQSVVASGMVTPDQIDLALTKLYGTPDYGNKTIYWNVIKYHTGDYYQVGWHIDGYVIDGSTENIYEAKYDYGEVSTSQIINGVPFANPTPVVAGEPVSQPAVTAKGYTFVGWTYEGELLTSELTMPNHNITLTAKWLKNLTINPNTGDPVTYDGTKKSVSGVVIDGLKEGDTVVKADGSKVTASAEGVDAGSYPVNFNVKDASEVKVMRGDVDVTEEYNVTLGSGNMVINKRDMNIVCDSLTVPYDGSFHLIGLNGESEHPGGFWPEGIVSGDHLGGFTVLCSEKNVNEYTVSPKIEEGGITVTTAAGKNVTENYNITVTDGKLNITPLKLTLTVTANSDTKEYSGKPQSVSGYKVDGLPAGLTLDGLSAGTTGTNANTYSTAVVGEPRLLTSGGEDVTANYDLTLTRNDGTLTIRKAALSVTANNTSREYGKPNPKTFVYTVTGLKGEDKVDTIGLTITCACAANETSLVGDYDITPKGAAEIDNYTVTYHPGTLTIYKSGALAVSATPYNGTYDGAAHGGVTTADTTVPGAQITYSTDGKTYSAEMPRFKDAGEYPVYVRAAAPGYEDAYKTVTAQIGKAALAVTAQDARREYGEPNPAFGSTASGLKEKDTLETIGLTVNYDCAADETSPVDVYAITPKGAAETDNYKVSYFPGKLTVFESSSLAVDAAAYSGTYDGAAHDGVTTAVPTVSGAQVTYSTDGEHYSTEMPQFTNAGEYPVYVKAAAPGYKDAVETVTVKIGKADLAITAQDARREYGEPNPAFGYTASGLKGTDTVATIGLSVSCDSAADETSPADNYAIIPTGAKEITNYTVEYYPGTLTVVDRLAVSATAYNGIYDGAAHDGVTTVVPTITGAQITYSTDGEHYFTEMPQFTNAGEYPVYVKAAASGYKNVVETVTVRIGKADLAVTAVGASREYGQPNPAFGYTASGLQGTDTVATIGLSVSCDCAADETSPVGDYDITPKGAAETDNYKISYFPGTLTVFESGQLAVTATPYGGTYDGTAHDGITAATPTVPGAQITYSTDGEHYFAEMPQFTNAGEYPVYVKATAQGYTEANTTVTVRIGKANLAITAEDKAKTAGQADPALSAIITGLVGNDTLDYTLARDAGEAVGTYAIRVALGSNPNYNVVSTDGILTITATAPTTPGTTTPTDPTTPTTPTAPTTPGATTPIAPTTPGTAGGTTTTPAAANDQTTIADNQTPLAGANGDENVNIQDNETPLAAGSGNAAWALLNLLLAIATGIIMIVLLVFYFVGKTKKDEEEENESLDSRAERMKDEEEQGKLKRKGIVRLLSIIPTVVAVVLFFLTENMRNPMIWVDQWTIWMAVIAIVQVVVAVFTKKNRKKDEEQDEEAAPYAQTM